MASLKFLNKQFPTILGLLLLAVSLGVGVFFMRDGLGIFTPRATPQTTPKNIKITNVTDSTITISFFTDEKTTGFVKYGTSENSLNTQASDDRDQLSGNVGTFNTHHVTLRNLQAATNYFFIVGTVTDQYDNNGQPYTVKTATKLTGANSTAQTIYGNVLQPDSSPADGAIVYLTVEGAMELSALVRSSGTWAIPLVQLRSPGGGNPPSVSATTPMQIFVQGDQEKKNSTLVTTVGQPQFPVKTITLSTDGATSGPDNGSGTDNEPQFTASGSATITQEVSPTPTATLALTTPIVSITASATATPTKAITTTLSPTHTPTATPTLIATKTPTPTLSASQPATTSPQPISGSVGYTFLLIMTGVLLSSIGGVLILLNPLSDKES